MDSQNHSLSRYDRQIIYPPFGAAGQKALAASSALVIGVGGLGSWTAELLVRAGVGRLRLADNDHVELVNLHRQALYDEADAAESRPKVQAAARRLKRLNADAKIETSAQRVTADNLAELARDVNLILDGSDNFAVRFIINDYCVKNRLPWVFAGVVGAEAQVMPIVPGQTACLRCVYDSPAPPCMDPTCRAAGVLGPAVATIAAMQAMEALKILSGNPQTVSPFLTKLDMWGNTVQRIDTTKASAAIQCPCCKQGQFDYLEA